MSKKKLELCFSFILLFFLSPGIAGSQWVKKWEALLPEYLEFRDLGSGEVYVAGMLKGDFDGNGILDLVVYDYENIVIHRGTNGSIWYGILAVPNRVEPIVVDIDGDGRDEIIISDQEHTAAYEYIGSTDATTQQMQTIPQTNEIYQNFPNPFNPKTNIKYSIKYSGPVEIVIFNEIGQKVRTLIEKRTFMPGDYSIEWDGKDDNLNMLPNGTYFYQIRTGDFISAKKAVIVK